MESILWWRLLCIHFFATAVSSTDDFNEFFNVSGSIITSPNFPSKYNDDMTYKYLVQAPSSCLVELSFSNFDVENNMEVQYRCLDTLKIYDGNSSNSRLLRVLCGPYLPSSVYSSGNEIYMIFESDSNRRGTGFKAFITFLDEYSEKYRQIDKVRLNGGNNVSEGRIELLVEDQWGPVCGENFDIKMGNVICIEIGYDFAVKAASRKFWVKPYNLAPFYKLSCSGNGEKLSSCEVVRDYTGCICPNWELAELVCGSNVVKTARTPTESSNRIIKLPSMQLVVMNTVFVLLVVLLGLVALKWKMGCKRRRSEELTIFQQRTQPNPAAMAHMLDLFLINEQMRRGNGPALPARRLHAHMQQIRANTETPSTSDVFTSNPRLNAGCSDTLTSLRSDDVFNSLSDGAISRLTTLGRQRGSSGGTSNLESERQKLRFDYLSIADDSDDADVCDSAENNSTFLRKSIDRLSSEDTVYEQIC